MLSSDVQKYWNQLNQTDEADWCLAEAALMFAKQMYPQLDPQAYLNRLAELAQGVERACDGECDTLEYLDRINTLLYEELALRGNSDDFHDPRNSYLNEVLDRGLGIPISLSVIYMDIARRLGLEVHGINFPGHFLLRVETAGEPIIVDAYAGGQRLDREQIAARVARLDEMPQGAMQDVAQLLQAAGPRQVLVRMLRNLKNIYIQNQQAAEGLAIVELILRLVPDSPDELRDRGMIYHHLEYTPAALADLTRYLALVPEGPERPAVEALVESLQEQGTSLH